MCTLLNGTWQRVARCNSGRGFYCRMAARVVGFNSVGMECVGGESWGRWVWRFVALLKGVVLSVKSWKKAAVTLKCGAVGKAAAVLGSGEREEVKGSRA